MVARLLLLFITVYQRVISPLMPARCRFYPSCSAYGAEAIRVHGALKGSLLAARRVTKCHPFNPGGFDPVPPAKHEHTTVPSRAPHSRVT